MLTWHDDITWRRDIDLTTQYDEKEEEDVENWLTDIKPSEVRHFQSLQSWSVGLSVITNFFLAFWPTKSNGVVYTTLLIIKRALSRHALDGYVLQRMKNAGAKGCILSDDETSNNSASASNTTTTYNNNNNNYHKNKKNGRMEFQFYYLSSRSLRNVGPQQGSTIDRVILDCFSATPTVCFNSIVTK